MIKQQTATTLKLRHLWNTMRNAEESIKLSTDPIFIKKLKVLMFKTKIKINELQA